MTLLLKKIPSFPASGRRISTHKQSPSEFTLPSPIPAPQRSYSCSCYARSRLLTRAARSVQPPYTRFFCLLVPPACVHLTPVLYKEQSISSFSTCSADLTVFSLPPVLGRGQHAFSISLHCSWNSCCQQHMEQKVDPVWCPKQLLQASLLGLKQTGDATLDFLAPFLPPVFFDTVFFCDGDLAFFAGGGVMMASSFPFDPRFFANSSGWILGNTPPLAMVTPFNS